MTWRAVLASLIMLTTLDGKPLWVESTQVFIVRHSLDCAHGEATTIVVGGKAFCVREKIDDVRERIRKGNVEEYRPPF